MTRAIFVPMKRLASAVTVLALAACTGGDGGDGGDATPSDSVLTQVQSDPAGAPNRVQPETLTPPRPSQSGSAPTPTPPVQTTPAPPRQQTVTPPPRRQPPPPRDTRPSIPFPPDTL